jgi:hypothetical protein
MMRDGVAVRITAEGWDVEVRAKAAGSVWLKVTDTDTDDEVAVDVQDLADAVRFVQGEYVSAVKEGDR